MMLVEDLRLLGEKRALEVEFDESDGSYTIEWPTGHWIMCSPNGDVFIGKLGSGNSPERIICRKNHITGIATRSLPDPNAPKDTAEHWYDRLVRHAEEDEAKKDRS